LRLRGQIINIQTYIIHIQYEYRMSENGQIIQK